MLGGDEINEISYEDLVDYRLPESKISKKSTGKVSTKNKQRKLSTSAAGGSPPNGPGPKFKVSSPQPPKGTDKREKRESYCETQLEEFLLKIDVTTNKLNSDKFFEFYRNVISTKFLPKFEKEVETLTRHLKLLKNASNSKDSVRIAEALTKIKYVLQIDDYGITPWVSPKNVELYLSKSTPRKIGNLHEELLDIMKCFGVFRLDDRRLIGYEMDVDIKKKII
jgi:hypothetical protein